jgi:GGDEF domain-containing protein
LKEQRGEASCFILAHLALQTNLKGNGFVPHERDRRNETMAKLDQKELKSLEKREKHLSILAAVFVLVQASGMALLMYPMVFLHPEEGNKLTMRIAFVGFCVLTLLFVTYLFDRQKSVRKLKQSLVEEMERNVELRNQANVDLLHGLADLKHFHDQLSMEFRRAMTMKQPLSVIAVKVNVAVSIKDAKDVTAALGDAVKGIAKCLRPTDATYLLAPGLFGVILAEVAASDANLIEMKIDETLRSISAGKYKIEITTCNYPEQVQSAHELEDVVASLMPQKQVWEEVGSSR